MEQRYIISPFIRAGYLNNTLFFGFGSIQKIIKDKKTKNLYLDIATFFKTPKTLNSAKAQFKSSLGPLQTFFDERFVIKDQEYNSKNRYSRHQIYYELSQSDGLKVQNKLEKSHVVILGCGGIGNLVALSLATAGVGELTLIDNDTIELSNLTRQYMFTENDINKQKVSILKRELEKRNSKIKINIIKKGIKNKKCLYSLPSNNLVIVSADYGPISSWTNDYSINSNTAWINVGYVEDIAIWGPFVIPGKTGCFSCQSNIASEKNSNEQIQSKIKQLNSLYQAPSTGPINMMASSFACLDILKYLGQFGQIQSLNKRIGIWTHELKLEEQSYKKNIHCKTCGINHE